MVPEAPALPVKALHSVTLAHRAVTLRSAQSLPRTVAVAVALAQVLQQRALAVAEAISAQKGRRPVLRERTARVAGGMALRQQA